MRTIRTTHALTLAAAIIVWSLGGAVAHAQSATTMQKPAPKTPAAVTIVNLNTATQVELEKLPGIGPSTATRIIEYRQKNGNFKKIEDLMNIRGIGEKAFLKLKPLVTVAPQKTDGK